MKISLLHGGDSLAKLKKLDELTKEFGDGIVVRAHGKEITNEFVMNHFGVDELFGEKKLIILSEPSDDLELDKLPDSEVEVILVYEKELGVRAKILKAEKIKSAKIYNFVMPQDRRIWTLLDLVLDNDPKMVGLVNELIEEFGGQYILTMMIYNLRRLILINGPDFVKNKLLAVRKKWGIAKIRERYQDCLETDRKIKTGLGTDKDLINLMVINWMN